MAGPSLEQEKQLCCWKEAEVRCLFQAGDDVLGLCAAALMFHLENLIWQQCLTLLCGHVCAGDFRCPLMSCAGLQRTWGENEQGANFPLIPWDKGHGYVLTAE